MDGFVVINRKAPIGIYETWEKAEDRLDDLLQKKLDDGDQINVYAVVQGKGTLVGYITFEGKKEFWPHLIFIEEKKMRVI